MKSKLKINELKAGALLSYIAMFSQNIINIVYTPFLLRSLGQNEYGLYILMGSLVGYIGVMDFGLSSTMVKYISQYRMENNRIKESNLVTLCLIMYGVLALIAIILGIVLFFYLDVIFGHGLAPSEMSRAHLMFVFLVFNIAISFPINAFTAVMNGYEKFVFTRIISISQIIVLPCIMVPLLFFGYKAMAIIVLNTALNLIIGTIYIFYVLFKLKVKIKLHYIDSSFIKELISYSFFVFIGVIVDLLYWRTGQVVLGISSGTKAVSVFAIAMQFCGYYMNFSTAISGVFLPRTTRMVNQNNNKDEITDLFIRTGRVQFIILSFILGGFILLGREFIILWAGKEYSDAWLWALVIMIPLTVPLIQTVGISILQAKNMHSFRSIMYLCIAVVNLIISVVLVQYIGGLGTALGTAMSLVMGNIIAINLYYHYKAKINIIRFFRNIATLIPSMVIAMLVGIPTLLLPGNSWTMFFIQGITYMLAYGLAIWFLGANKHEKQLLYDLFKIISDRVKRPSRSLLK